ncbi:hypothetical protein A8B98_07765 [Hymenobacter sp. UV11]|nr:hypothetical protein A8B98_07765 [Hymenobacter sp. UV11]
MLLGLTLVSACTTEFSPNAKIDAKTVTFNDFESGGGWSNDPSRNDPGLVEKGLAHSGQYALKVDKDHEFSLTYAMALGKMREAKFQKLHLEAWAFMPSDQATGVVGLQVLSPDNSKQIFSDDIKLRDAVKTYGEWVFVSKDITLPDSVAPAQQLRLYLWRADAGDKVLLDDVKLSILD